MARINLLSGTYQARSIIADAQRCVNLYPEHNPESDQDHPVTHYPTPGLDLLANSPTTGISRLNYRASNGDFYRVIGQGVYYVSPSWAHTLLGTIVVGSNICSMSDNGLVIVLVDGTSSGYVINMSTRTFGTISSPYFFGANKVDYLDTFFLFNLPNTNEFYISLSNVDFSTLTGTVGAILTGSISSPGSAYTNGTYAGVALTSGSGSGAIATIIVSGGIVASVTITSLGINYLVGDVLSATPASIGGTGAGFGYSVDTTSGGGFDPLDLAAKDGSPDPIVTLVVMHLEIWLIGALTTEIWYNAGAADFTFQRLPGTFIEHGCVALYSLAKHDLSVFWLSQDREGQAIVIMGTNYKAYRISTHAIEYAIASYSTISDAIGSTYQQEGHVFYVLTFPTANKTWVYDKTAELWHERNCLSTDGNGYLNRHILNTTAFVYGKNTVGDYRDGTLYAFDLDAYTDNGNQIPRIRAFPHILEDDNRMLYQSFTADVECGNDMNGADDPQLSLRWSDNRGRSYGNKIEQSLGATGDYLTSVQWNRLGYARDRVFELRWSVNAKTSLQGAFIETRKAST